MRQRWPWNRRSGPTSLVENIDGMPEDDDLNYPILNLQVLEQVGPDFTVEDIAGAWLNDLPAGRVFTAERAAYRNLLEGVTPTTPPLGETRSGNGSERSSGPTCSAGSTRAGRPTPLAQRTRTPGSPTPAMGSTVRPGWQQ